MIGLFSSGNISFNQLRKVKGVLKTANVKLASEKKVRDYKDIFSLDYEAELHNFSYKASADSPEASKAGDYCLREAP